MMDKFKNKNLIVIIFEIIIILLSILGITLATSKLINNSSTAILTTEGYNVDYIGEKEVRANGLEPISDKFININTTDKVVRLEFSLKGVNTNKTNDIIYDIMLNQIDIDTSLMNEYTKWNLYKNGSLLSSGNFSPSFDINIMSDNYRLTTIQEDLPEYTDDYDKYVLIIWISEACNDTSSCKYVDQSNIVNSKLAMNIFVALYSGSKKEYTRVSSYDTSASNKPELVNGMVPVRYNNGSWVVASEKNTSSDAWYNYDNREWANAVIVKNENMYRTVGTTINDNDILGYFVWIPRFKYQVWNIEEEITDSYNAYKKGINILFERDNKTTGTVTVDEDTVNGKNDEYLTHPAFKDNTGFWISKYELGNNNQFISNNQVVINKSLDEFRSIVNNMRSDYGVSNIDLINNLEWGAVAYLSHSKYGTCIDYECMTYGVNDEYISGNNKQDTTTRSVYGVYDMAGSASEYVFGNNNIGAGMSEVVVNKNNIIWDKVPSVSEIDEYILRGGVGTGLFSTSLSEMSNRTIRVTINK